MQVHLVAAIILHLIYCRYLYVILILEAIPKTVFPQFPSIYLTKNKQKRISYLNNVDDVCKRFSEQAPKTPILVAKRIC